VIFSLAEAAFGLRCCALVAVQQKRSTNEFNVRRSGRVNWFLSQTVEIAVTSRLLAVDAAGAGLADLTAARDLIALRRHPGLHGNDIREKHLFVILRYQQ
jgi:hypothetical protein